MPHTQSPFDAERYVKENNYPLVIKDYSNIGLVLRCIDDLSPDSEDRTRDIAIPGAGLGLVMDALGAFTLLRRRGKHATLMGEEAINAVERALGVILYHTDDKSAKNKGVLCGGCGHCNGALVDPVKYLLSGSDAKYFVEAGLEDIKGRLKLRGVKPVVYAGGHNARAVFIIESLEVGLPSVGKTEERVYVYHRLFHERFLSLIAHELAPLLSSHTQGVSEEELASMLIESARTRLEVTVNKLAATLPKYAIQNKPEVSVSKLT